ncbi:streptomycin biosynthesis regulator [Acaryochloris marina NIES-2412]|uniref:streptomycin biosynthesis regulator n=1 Tax=Acaryochloris marina TaxID=155978 RepID=UPI00405A032C
MPSKKPQSQSSEPSIQTVEIAKIRRDGGTQPRAQLYEEVVAEYAEDMRQGAEFPPITIFFDGEQYWLADGFHRVSAKEATGEKKVISQVHSGTQRDAVLYAAGANAAHGLRRTNADKRRAVEHLLRDFEWSRWSDNAIANQCGVSHPFVSKLRAGIVGDLPNSEFAVRTAKRGGKTYTLDTTNIGQSSSSQASKTSKRQRKKKQASQVKSSSPLVQSKKIVKGDTWKLGKFHYLFCGDPSSKKFQKLLPSEIGLFMTFLDTEEHWPNSLPVNTKNALLFYSSYGEDIDLRNLRQIIENCLTTTTDAEDTVVMINLPDPSIFILMESLYCLCYCAEPDPQRCTDALTVWATTNQPVKKL